LWDKQSESQNAYTAHHMYNKNLNTGMAPGLSE